MAAEGDYEVIKEGKILGSLGVGKAFGELAILYNCKRTASIKAVTDGKVWALERKVFQQIMVSSGLKKMENQVTENIFITNSNPPCTDELPESCASSLRIATKYSLKARRCD